MNYIPEVIYGGVDGIITTFAIIAGSAAANFDKSILITLGLASIAADGFSMGISSFLAEKARKAGNNPFIVGLVTFVSFVIIGIIPMIPFLLSKKDTNKKETEKKDTNKKEIILSFAIMICILFILGFMKGSLRNAIETSIIGSIAAGLAYFIASKLKKK